MGLGRRLADHQLAADLRVGQAPDEQVQHLALARRQLADRRRDGRLGADRDPGELLDDRSGHGRGEQRVAAGHDADRGCDLLRRRVLEHEPARASPQRVVDVVIEAERGQDQHPRGRLGTHDPAGGLDAVQNRHADVHEHHVGPEPPGGCNRVLAVAGLPHHGGLRLVLQDLAQADPDQRLVVGDQQCRHGAGVHSGSSTRTAKPPPRRADASNLPPYRLTRSRMPARPCPPPGTSAAVPAPSSAISSSSESEP